MNSTLRDEYNNIPVHYCKCCLSLNIKTVIANSDLDFCEDCGATDIGQTHIETWRKEYKDRYGFDYLDKH